MNLGHLYMSSCHLSDFSVYAGERPTLLSALTVKLCMAVDPVVQQDGVILDSRLGSIANGWGIGRAKFFDKANTILCCVGYTDTYYCRAIQESSLAAIKWCQKQSTDAVFDLTDLSFLNNADDKEVLCILRSIADVAPLTYPTRSYAIVIHEDLAERVREHCCLNPPYHRITLVKLSRGAQDQLDALCDNERCGDWFDAMSDKVVTLDDVSDIYSSVSKDKYDAVQKILSSATEHIQVGYSWTYMPLNKKALNAFCAVSVLSKRAAELLKNPV